MLFIVAKLVNPEVMKIPKTLIFCVCSIIYLEVWSLMLLDNCLWAGLVIMSNFDLSELIIMNVSESNDKGI